MYDCEKWVLLQSFLTDKNVGWVRLNLMQL